MDPLPLEFRKRNKLPALSQAFRFIHLPEMMKQVDLGIMLCVSTIFWICNWRWHGDGRHILNVRMRLDFADSQDRCPDSQVVFLCFDCRAGAGDSRNCRRSRFGAIYAPFCCRRM